MGIDYYGVLDLNKCASLPEIKQAYRKFALMLHPERVQEDEQEEKDVYVTFYMIGEAYDVLSDPFYRAVYDQYGEEGLKSGVPGPHEYIQSYAYHGDAMRTYKDFFGTCSPFADLLDVLIHPLPFYKDGTRFGVKKKDPEVYYPLPLTLEEVFYGGPKQVLIHKRELCEPNSEGQQMQTVYAEVLLTIEFEPGIEPGTKFRFPEAGNQGIAIIPADVIFVTEDVSHPVYTREHTKEKPDAEIEQQLNSKCKQNQHQENRLDEELTIINPEIPDLKDFSVINKDLKPPLANISAVMNITLCQALTGFTATVNTIDGKLIRVAIIDVVTPSYEKIIKGEGLPIFRDKKGKRGDIVLRFEVVFPSLPLPKKNRDMINQALSPCIMRGDTNKFQQIDDINRSILADKMSKVASREQAPPKD